MTANTFSFQPIIQFIPQLGLAALILILGYGLARFVKKVCLRLAVSESQPIFMRFFASFVYASILVVVGVLALSLLGVPTATLITVLGAISLTVGLALKDSLSNIAAGFMLIFLKPFKTGDFIDVNGEAGKVIEINLFATQLKSSSNEAIFLPNNKLITSPITNKTLHSIRRLNLNIGIGYSADITKAKNIVQTILEQHPSALKKPAPFIGVESLADSSIKLTIRIWARHEDLLTLHGELLETIKQAFDAASIEIPFPQLIVHKAF